MGFTKEKKFEIWDDDTGAKIEVGPDRDSLGLVEIRAIESDGRLHGTITMLPGQALLVSECLKEAATCASA